MGMLWVEKYRPRNLESMALDPEHRVLLEEFLAWREIPHLIMAGPPGCGKTTTAKILTNALDCQVLALNASKDRGIDIVRERVGIFARARMGARWKIVFLDEADGMTPDAQNSLRSLMEDFHHQTRFILTANNLMKIISPIQSRCTVLAFGGVPMKERLTVLANVLTCEGVQFDMKDVLSYGEAFSDLRRMINAAQKSVIVNKGVLKPAKENQVYGEALVKLVIANDWGRLVSISADPLFDHRRALQDMFWAVEDAHPQSSTWRFKIAKAVHECSWTPDPVVHFLGLCAELLEGETK